MTGASSSSKQQMTFRLALTSTTTNTRLDVSPNPVTLQISLAPTDLPTAVHTVPHQLRQWGDQVDEILLTVDLHRSRGKFAEGWEERLPGLRELIRDCCAQYPHARSVDVDYGSEAEKAVAAAFFGGRPVPLKDYRGAPFYSYLFSIYSARNDRVFHLDSDMLFGGGSRTWVNEAVDVLNSRPDVLACNPLPGPPTADGTLRSQVLERDPMGSAAFWSPALSTRLFLMDLGRLPVLEAARVTGRPAWHARIEGNQTFNTLENVISLSMASRGLVRVDFLGRPPGMWAVHPPWRSPTFFRRLPDLIQEIEQERVPDEQRGFHEVEDCMVDWTDVRPSSGPAIVRHSRRALERLVVPLTAKGQRRGS
jgi:hypothetical protein